MPGEQRPGLRCLQFSHPARGRVPAVGDADSSKVSGRRRDAVEMTHKMDRVLSVKELARVEGEGALYLWASGDRVEEARLGLDDAELTRQCEQAIRNYDPCISCSAHFLDLTVERS